MKKKNLHNFKYIYDLAKCSKCQMFILLKQTNKLYGASDDACCVHEIDVPFLVDTDLVFRVSKEVTDLVSNYENYFIPEKFFWVILPDYYWDMYVAGDLDSIYDADKNSFLIIDKSTLLPIEQIQMYKFQRAEDYEICNFESQLEGLLRRRLTLSEPECFTNMEQHPVIREVFDSKVSIGSKLCRLKNENIDVQFYFFKTMFSLAKSDTLDIEIREDRYSTNMFMATFLPKKKKDPLTFNTFGVPFKEQIHCMYLKL